MNVKFKVIYSIFGAMSLLAAFTPSAAHADYLNSAASFGVLGGSTVTNTGLTTVIGNLGVWPGTAVTGFGPGIVTGGAIHAGDAVAQAAHNDTVSAFAAFSGMAFNTNLTGQNLGGLTLTPGVYFFSTSAALNNVVLTLDGQGNANAEFIFRIGSTLITASSASVVGINGADGCNVYWQVGSSATLGTGTAFMGSILAQASITMNTNASILMGRALAIDGAVTLDSNAIDTTCSVIPAPGAAMVIGLCGVLARRRRHSAVR
ncbi:MAG: DUF3494 domain-containing protein [Planctomycetes bacterium]|nr:DUF3494 domain-containing protein [Planctomycetota bacterium]